MQSVLKLSLLFNQQCIKSDLKNLENPNWDEVIEEQKLDVYKLRMILIDVEKFFLWYYT